MYRDTRLGEIMKGVSRGFFDRVVKKTQADKYSKGFSSWDQFVVMIYAQLSGSASLRGLLSRFNSQPGQHYHLGTREIKRSTLADANRNRSVEVFKQVCAELLGQAHGRVRRDGRDLLYLLDSTSIPLRGWGYEWAEATQTGHTQGLKWHLVYAPQAQVPVYSHVSAPNVNDIEVGRGIRIETGATYVFDKGYCDYNWWYRIDQKGARFVTRFKANASLETLHRRPIALEQQDTILEDSVVHLANRYPGGGRVNHYQKPLRRIVVYRPDKAKPLVLATNDLKSPAQVVAQLYKARWGIELYFKWLKQHLKIKRFLGRSENAVRIQILTALIAYLLIDLYRRRHRITTSLHLLLVELSVTLFQRPRVEAYVTNRYRRKRIAFETMQGALPL